MLHSMAHYGWPGFLMNAFIVLILCLGIMLMLLSLTPLVMVMQFLVFSRRK